MTAETDSHPVAVGAEHTVGSDELFFSTTDRRGVIRSANSVFARISRFPLDRLVGRPHNLVRHPRMPRGAFELMWSRLLAGQPMAAYVQNLAADGGSYWVFATITPYGDGFLSVRGAPMTPLFDTVREVYDVVLAREQEMAARGHHRGEVARYGAELIEQAVRTLGYPTYEAFMYDALATEVAARRRSAGAARWSRPVDGAVGEVLAAVEAMERALDGLDDQVATYAELAGRLGPAAAEMLQSAAALEEIAGHAEDVSRSVDAPVVRNTARVLRRPMAAAIESLADVASDLTGVLHAIRRERFSIALARLHAEMTGMFAIEAADGLAPDGALRDVPALCLVMGDDVRDLIAGSQRLDERLDSIAGRIDTAAELTDRFGYFVGEWERTAVRRMPHVALGPILGPVEEQLIVWREHLGVLREVATTCRSAADGFDVRSFATPLDRVRNAASATV